MAKTFIEQFRADYAHYCQLGAARKRAFLASKPASPDMVTTSKRSLESWEYPALASETKEDAACIRRVRAVQSVERLYAGILSDASFRLTTLGKPAKPARKPAKPAANGATVPARQTVLA